MAYAVLLSWPLVAVMLFGALGREKGLIWAVILGYLLLSENIAFELPGLPDYGKGEQKLPVYKMPHLEGWAVAGDLAFGIEIFKPEPF